MLTVNSLQQNNVNFKKNKPVSFGNGTYFIKKLAKKELIEKMPPVEKYIAQFKLGEIPNIVINAITQTEGTK